jgi:hypothetical protein
MSKVRGLDSDLTEELCLISQRTIMVLILKDLYQVASILD